MIRALATALVVTASLASAGTPTLAVTYFDNNSGDPQYDPLRKGLADMLITDLVNVSSLRVVERDRLNSILDELKLSQTKFVDKSAAQKMGKLLSAEFVLTGGLQVKANKLRIDARVVKVETGSPLSAQAVEGPLDDFFSVEKDLVDAILADLQVKLAPDEKSKLRRNQTQSFQAFNAYSKGLDAKDRGDAEEAARQFKSALDLDPGYASAKNQVERIDAMLKVARAQQAAPVAAAAAGLDPKSPDFASKAQEVLMATMMARDPESVGRGIAVLRMIVEKDLKPTIPNGLQSVHPEAIWLPVLADRFIWDPDTVELTLPVYEYLLRKYPDDRLLTQSNVADSPKNIQRQIDLKHRDAAFMKQQFDSMDFYAPFRPHQKAAQDIFKLVASKLPAKK
ncbi:MAG: CsgG/HfaB family protein [Myxococcaceae bacterium]